MVDRPSVGQVGRVLKVRDTAMTRPLSGKAEIVLVFPDLTGTFGPSDQCEARFDADDICLTLQRSGDTGVCRSVRLNLEPQVLADILTELAESVSGPAPADPNCQVLREAAEALARALESTGELTPDEEVLLLHVME